MALQTLHLDHVEAAIQSLNPDLPLGEARFQALQKALMDMFGACTIFTPNGLTRLERWTGKKVRGEPA